MPEKSNLTILLVDDDPVILELGRELLTHLEYRVETASDAAQALEAFQKQRTDLVLLDYQLPGMDGYQLFQKLRALDAGVKVLIASGFLSERQVARLREGGVRGIIYKPFRLAELQRQIQAALVR
ncbi:MAG: response regulator [Deltaproteobacteria bacterium]|nr:response regulator [Deltaproteobacteria bacterium]